MTNQLSLFAAERSVDPSSLEGHRKTCATCKEEFYIPDGQHRTRPYCNPCQNAHARSRRSLRDTHVIPVDHSCDCCGKSVEDLTIHYGKNGQAVSPWRLDHCHETGEFRGWLCHNCNSGLGRFYDDPDLLIKAIQYIQKDRP